MALAHVSSNAFFNGSATSFTINTTCSGDDRLAIISALTGEGNILNDPTVGGNATTMIRDEVQSGQNFHAFYYLSPPTASTAYTQTTSITAGVGIAVDIYSGALQSAGVIDSSAFIASGAVPRTFSTTVVDSDCWLWSMARNINTGVIAPHTGTTGRTNGTLHDTGDSNGTVGTGSQSLAWTDSSGNAYGMVVSISPAVAGGGSFTPRVSFIM